MLIRPIRACDPVDNIHWDLGIGSKSLQSNSYDGSLYGRSYKNILAQLLCEITAEVGDLSSIASHEVYGILTIRAALL